MIEPSEDSSFKKIIVRMPNWVGDLVMATPILTDIKQRWPEAELTAMCLSPISDVLMGHPAVDKIFSFTRPNGFIHRILHRHLIDRLRQGQYDLGVLLTNSFSSAWWFWRGGIAHRVGFKTDRRSLLLSDPVAIPKEWKQEHLITTYKRLLLPLGIPLSETLPTLALLPEEIEKAHRFLERYKIKPGTKLIGIHPGASYGSAKCWIPERFEELSQRLLRQDPQALLLFLGTEGQGDLIRAISKGLPENRSLNLAGKTSLRELMALISLCSVVLSNDSGPMHVAAALQVPVVALFGSTSDQVTGPFYGPHRVIHKRVACSPCYLRSCPIDFRCMREISVDEVFEALQQIDKAPRINSHNPALPMH